MSKENISQELRLRNIDERRNYFLEEIEQNEIISNKHKKGLYNSKLYWRRLLDVFQLRLLLLCLVFL